MATLKVTNIKNESFTGDQLYLKSDGSIGIGTTNPTSDGGTTLEIYHTTVPTLKLNDGGQYKSLLQLRGNDLEIRGSSGTIEFFNGNADGASASERMRIDSSGHVMIGTTTEGFATYGDQLTIANSGHCGMTIRSGSSSDGNIYFSDGTSGADEVRGFMEYNHTSNYMNLGTNGGWKLRIDSSGHVGLGISPSDVDSIGKALNIASSTGGAIYLQDTDSPTTKFAAISYNGGTAALQIHAHHSSSYIDLGTNGTERLRVTSDGVIGIGSTSPGTSSKVFSYQSNASAGNNIILENNYSANNTTTLLKAYRLGGAVGYALQYKDSTTRMRQGTYTNHPMELITNDNARITIANDGHCVFSNSIALNGETAAANRLDDYEEGTWTPAYGSSSVPSSTYTNTGGHYTKVGNLVTFTGRIQMSASTVNSNDLTMGGFPFPLSSSKRNGGFYMTYQDNWFSSSSGGTAQVTFLLVQNTQYGYFYDGDGTVIDADDTYDSCRRTMHFQGFYYTD